MKETIYPYKRMPTELNEMWQEVFGHTFQECFQLAQLPDEIGKLHQNHIKYILNRSLEQKPLVTFGEDG